MTELNIPTEVKDKSAFPQVDKTARLIIAYAVLMGADNQSAFMRFHPEFIDASGKAMNGAGKQASRQFWGYGKVKDYRELYEKELAEFLGRKQKAATIDLGADISEEDKAKALRSMFRYVIDNSIDIEKLDDPTTLLKIADKIGFFDQLERKQMPPIRVLPARCSECRYKAFVESSVLDGSAIDCCAYCKSRRFAEEHGYRFNDGKDLLEIPENVIKELEEKNNVKLEDIISGRIQN